MGADKMEPKTIVVEESSPYGDFVLHFWSNVEEALASERFDYLKEQYEGDNEESEWVRLKIEECETLAELVAKVPCFHLEDQRCGGCGGEYGEECAFESKRKTGLCKDCAEDDDPDSEDEEETKACAGCGDSTSYMICANECGNFECESCAEHQTEHLCCECFEKE